MTRILRNTFSAAFMVSAAIMLAGCPSGVGANIPGATGMGGTTTTPGGTTTTPTTGAAACAATSPSLPAQPGTSVHGAYNNQNLPNGWPAAYSSEAEVTARFKQAEGGADWNCMQKFYAGAITVYNQKKNQ